jgi:hypothetical protein
VAVVRATADLSTEDGAAFVEAARRDALARVACPKRGPGHSSEARSL